MNLTREQQLLQQVVHEAWDNDEFRAQLVANPVETIEAFTGQKLNLPEGKTLVVRDQTDESTYFINIPAEQQMDDVELSEKELEAVAGGRGDKPHFNGIGDLMTIFKPSPFDPTPKVQL